MLPTIAQKIVNHDLKLGPITESDALTSKQSTTYMDREEQEHV